MMLDRRPTKFRAWDVETKCMIYGIVQADCLYQGHSRYGKPIQRDGIESFGDYLARPWRYVVRQYTGVDDKGGTPIYDGDWIFDGTTEEEGVVKFENGVFNVELDGETVLISDLITDQVQVIGNECQGRIDGTPEGLLHYKKSPFDAIQSKIDDLNYSFAKVQTTLAEVDNVLQHDDLMEIVSPADLSSRLHDAMQAFEGIREYFQEVNHD